jgi:alkylation response protein AidB-like acyl-CoA dehydrogenase
MVSGQNDSGGHAKVIYAYVAGRLHAAWVPADARGVMVIDDWNGMGQRTTGSGTVCSATWSSRLPMSSRRT